MSMKNLNYCTGKRTRDLPACSVVPQSIVPPPLPVVVLVVVVVVVLVSSVLKMSIDY